MGREPGCGALRRRRASARSCLPTHRPPGRGRVPLVAVRPTHHPPVAEAERDRLGPSLEPCAPPVLRRGRSGEPGGPAVRGEEAGHADVRGQRAEAEAALQKLVGGGRVRAGARGVRTALGPARKGIRPRRGPRLLPRELRRRGPDHGPPASAAAQGGGGLPRGGAGIRRRSGCRKQQRLRSCGLARLLRGEHGLRQKDGFGQSVIDERGVRPEEGAGAPDERGRRSGAACREPQQQAPPQRRAQCPATDQKKREDWAAEKKRSGSREAAAGGTRRTRRAGGHLFGGTPPGRPAAPPRTSSPRAATAGGGGESGGGCRRLGSGLGSRRFGPGPGRCLWGGLERC